MKLLAYMTSMIRPSPEPSFFSRQNPQELMRRNLDMYIWRATVEFPWRDSLDQFVQRVIHQVNSTYDSAPSTEEIKQLAQLILSKFPWTLHPQSCQISETSVNDKEWYLIDEDGEEIRADIDPKQPKIIDQKEAEKTILEAIKKDSKWRIQNFELIGKSLDVLKTKHKTTFSEIRNQINKLKTLIQGDFKKIKNIDEAINFISSFKNYIYTLDLSRFENAITDFHIQQLILYCSSAALLNIESSAITENSLQLLREFKYLSTLDLSNCKNIKGHIKLNSFPHLQEVNLSYTSIETLSCDGLAYLNKIELSRCSDLRSLSIKGCGALTEIQLYQCRSIEELTGLETCLKLELLNLNECLEIKKIEGLGHQEHLKTVNFNDCKNLIEAPGIENLTGLESLVLNGCTSITDFSFLSRLLENIERLPHESRLLQSLEASCCAIKKIQFPQLLSLYKIELIDCINLIEITGLEKCLRLQRGDFRDCASLQVVALPPSIQEADFGGCTQLKKISNLRSLHKLVSCAFDNCPSLEDELFFTSTSLQRLDVPNCNVKKISFTKKKPTSLFVNEAQPPSIVIVPKKKHHDPLAELFHS